MCEHTDHRLQIALDVFERKLSLETGDADGTERVAGLRHETLLHAALVAHIEHLRIRILLTEVTGHGQCRVDVSRGTAAGE